MVLTPLPHAATDLRDLAGQELRRFEPTEFRAQEDERTLEFSFSSELPVTRWFGDEVLDHSPEAVNLSRLNDGAPVLFNHDPDRVIGVVERAWVDGEKRRGMARVRFSRNEFAQQVVADINDGILRNVSVGYAIGEAENRGESIVATEWSPHEVSVVSIPADPTVGIGRSLDAGAPAQATPSTSLPHNMEDNTPNLDEVRAQAMAEERARVASITELCRTHKVDDKAQSFIERGLTVSEVQADILSELAKRPAQHAAPAARAVPIAGATPNAADIGLTDGEVRSFSFVRAINALANPSDRRAREAAAFEIECSEAAQQRAGKQSQGIMIPADVLRGQRDLVVGTSTAGGNLVNVDLRTGDFIDLLRNRLALANAGITMLNGLQGNVSIPRQSAAATAFWVGEGGSPTESQQSIDQVSMTPKTVGAFVDYSRKLLLQSSIDVESMIRMDLAKVLALEIDRVGIYGTGSTNQPLGLTNTTGVGTQTITGAGGTYAQIVNMETTVGAANADANAMKYILNAAAVGALKTTEKSASGTVGNFAIMDTTLNGYEFIKSNQLGTNDALFGDFSQMILGMWSGLDLKVDDITGATAGTVRVIALQDLDFAVKQPSAFVFGT